MFKIQNIKGTGDHIVAYKIIEKKYIDNMVNRGQIYFGLLEDYRRMEQYGKHEIGDYYEAALTNNIYEYILIDGSYEEFHGPNVGNHIRINANQCAFCFYMVGLKSYNKGIDGRYRFRIPCSDLEKMCNDKGGIENCAIVIFDRASIKKIYKRLKSMGLLYRGGKIIYDDLNYIPENTDTWSSKYALECCFHKQKQYTYQNEFRIAVLNREKKPIDDLFIEVEEKEFQVLTLKEGCDFCSCIAVKPNKKSEKIVEVSFHIEHTLKATTNET